MPGTGHHAIDNLAVAQRTAAVQAHVVEREEFITEPEYRDVAAGHGHHLAPAGHEIVDLSDRLKFGQRYFLAAGVSVVSFCSLLRM